MKNHNLRFRAEDKINFDTIADGRKTVETRAATVKYQSIQPGDSLTITRAGEKLTKTVKAVRHFDSVESLIEHYGIAPVMPLAKNFDEVLAEYHRYAGYKQKIKDHGLIALELA